MVRRLVVGVAAAALLTSACGGRSHDAAPPPRHLEVAGVVMARPAASIDYAPLRLGSRALGYDLGRALIDKAGDGNLVYSPASLAIAFAMLREGADARTGAVIDRVLHLPTDRHASYNGLVTALDDPGAGNVLALGNGIFLQDGYLVKQPFLAALKHWYGAGVMQTDFTSGQGVDDINGYVSDKTRGRIPHLIDQLPPDEVMMLVNTVFLDAKWQVPFQKYGTVTEPFMTGAGAEASVSMMRRTGEIEYAHGHDWQAVRLPYRGSRLSMWVLLPRGDAAPVELLSPAALAAAGSGFTATDVDLSLPRWDFDNTFDLVKTLESLGMRGVFNGAGDFSAITSDPTFEVTQVFQQANVTVGETGTVAAAATGVGAEAESAVAVPPVAFDADHPFAFAIMDDTTGTPLVEGTVADPSQTP